MPLATELRSFEGNIHFIIAPKASLRRTPSLTKNSRPTVIIPLFEKPASASVGVRIPALIKITTTEKSRMPGRILSFMSKPTITMMATRTMYLSKGCISVAQ